ncbi:hypothetical protein [Morganella morganii]|uniref:hypothetical protein n=1 Tax=Morganella morganii TaxID=582 RepID=UPI002023A1E1|nr:hypothetical protein [Morganella morganii]
MLTDQILLTGQAVQCIIFKPVRFFFFIDQRFQPPEAVVTEAETVSRRVGTLSDLPEDITGEGDFFVAAVSKPGDTPGIVIGIAVVTAVR